MFEEITLNFEGKPVNFRMRQLKLGERTDMLRESGAFAQVNSKETKGTDIGRFQELLLYYSIVEPKEYKDLTKIRELNIVDADRLLEVAQRVNGFTEDKKK